MDIHPLSIGEWNQVLTIEYDQPILDETLLQMVIYKFFETESGNVWPRKACFDFQKASVDVYLLLGNTEHRLCPKDFELYERLKLHLAKIPQAFQSRIANVKEIQEYLLGLLDAPESLGIKRESKESFQTHDEAPQP